MKQFSTGVLCAVFLLFLTGPVRAQFNANFQTNIISGTASNWAGFTGYVVGSNTFLDALIIENGGVLSNFAGIIGYTAAGSNNTVIVTGSGSIWSNSLGEGVTVGAFGMGNNLVISNGGAVVCPGGGAAVGYNVASSSNNTVTVTGTGSVWAITGEFDFGGSGKNNRMTISGGGVVHDTTGYLGLGSSNNVVTITDPGSVWSNGTMVVGQSIPNNQMTITNGGAVYSGMLIIGNASTSSTNGNVVTVTGAGSVLNVIPNNLEVGNGPVGNHMTISDGGAVHGPDGFVGFAGKNNVVTVTGAGSVWDGMVNLYVGNSSSTNTLTIGPGGSVVATNVYINYLVNAAANRINIEGGNLISTNVDVGNLTCASAAQLTVDAGNIIVTNAAHNAKLEIFSGTFTLNGGTAIVDRLVITNACARFVHAGGTLIVGSYVINQNEFRPTAVTPSSNDVLLTWMMGPGATNALQAAPTDPSGAYNTNAFTDIFVVTNNSAAGTVTNYLDVGAGTNVPAHYYRVRLVP